MEKNTYPNYSVYIQQGGQMVKPHGSGNRIQYFSKDVALVNAGRYWNRYKGQVDVLVLRYDGPYNARIVEIINRTE